VVGDPIVDYSPVEPANGAPTERLQIELVALAVNENRRPVRIPKLVVAWLGSRLVAFAFAGIFFWYFPDCSERQTSLPLLNVCSLGNTCHSSVRRTLSGHTAAFSFNSHG